MKKIITCLSLFAFLLKSQPVNAGGDDTPCGQGPACCCSAPTKTAYQIAKAAVNVDPAATVVATATFMGVWWYREQIAQTGRVVFASARLYPAQTAITVVAVALIAEAWYTNWADICRMISFGERA